MTLDAAYSNTGAVPNAASYPEAWEEAAFETRSVEQAFGRARLNIPYGDGARQKFDLFLPAGRAEGIVVFIHGGYWMKFDHSFWSHLAKGAQERGWAVAIPGYTLAPEARISDITGEIGQAISAAAGYVNGPIVLTGHSAGGHLVARMAMADAPLSPDISARLQRIVPISPVSDLRPLMQTAMNDTLKLDAAEAKAESPALHPKSLDVPVSVWVGADELPAFLDQADWLRQAWNAPVTRAAGKHHFNVIDPLADPDSDLIADLLRA
ncbi:alpha/beta hydrolase [Qingshengfaniella alkalisoli]|uniref:Alpha/beta hydrolase n=1 Tax=Qingshengfaniella alkalisoli TaxID=2599296 RepID=A0A5B8IVR3_9RHOB|nr:alpha/beta hydrolase [Qingshengfaniella alkalisoli]QDY69714.1 alpha/beta hydrolase [Qingshengfaniella alkalisoli]